MSESPHDGEDVFAKEEKLDEIAGYALFAGAMLSFVLVCTGLVGLTLNTNLTTLPAMPIREAFRSATGMKPGGVVSLGVLVLMATPLLRVVIATVGFAVLKWWRFAAICAIVLAMLLVSFFVAA